MSSLQPRGYRLPVHRALDVLFVDLTTRLAPVLRDEAVEVLADVLRRVLEQGEEQTLSELTFGQIGPQNLRVSSLAGYGGLARAAEFLDIQHVIRRLASSLPMAEEMNLRFSLSLLIETGDGWAYALCSCSRPALERVFADLPDVHPYPFDDSPAPTPKPGAQAEVDTDQESRSRTWSRLMRLPGAEDSPVTWTRRPELLFALVDSLRRPELDDERHAAGLVTATAVLRRLGELRGPLSEADRAQLLGRAGDQAPVTA